MKIESAMMYSNFLHRPLLAPCPVIFFVHNLVVVKTENLLMIRLLLPKEELTALQRAQVNRIRRWNQQMRWGIEQTVKICFDIK